MIPLDEVVHFDVVTHEPSTGAVSDADSTPQFDVFEEATDTPILSAQNFTKRTSKTGDYRGTFTASTANGFDVGKWYVVVASATVDGVAAKTVALQFRLGPAESVEGYQPVDVALSDGDPVPTAADVADAVLTRDWLDTVSAIGSIPARCLLQAVRFLRNAWFFNEDAELNVTEEDDTTVAWTKPVTTDPAAEPITGTGADA